MFIICSKCDEVIPVTNSFNDSHVVNHECEVLPGNEETVTNDDDDTCTSSKSEQFRSSSPIVEKLETVTADTHDCLSITTEAPKSETDTVNEVEQKCLTEVPPMNETNAFPDDEECPDDLPEIQPTPTEMPTLRQEKSVKVPAPTPPRKRPPPIFVYAIDLKGTGKKTLCSTDNPYITFALSAKRHKLDDGTADNLPRDLCCVRCYEHVNNVSDLSHHIRTKHTSRRRHMFWRQKLTQLRLRDRADVSCVRCCKLCVNTQMLKEHIRTKHKRQRIGAIKGRSKVAIVKCDTTEATAMSCVRCCKMFHHRIILNLHIRVYHKHQRFYIGALRKKRFLKPKAEPTAMTALGCTRCCKLFVNEWSLRQHIKANHRHERLTIGSLMNVRRLKCQHADCDMAYAKKSDLTAHVYKAHTRKRKTYETCEQCGLTIQSGASMNNHRNRHVAGRTGLMPRDVSCLQCEKVIASLKNLETHLQTHSQPTFKCEHCGRKFTYKHNYRNHVRTRHTHPDLRPFACKDCKARFKTQSNLLKHRRWMHNPELRRRRQQRRNFKCDDCGKAFRDREKLTAHRNGMPSTCELVRKKLHKCSVGECDREYMKRKCLEIHMLRNHDIVVDGELKASDLWPCARCGRYFATNLEQSAHLPCIGVINVKAHPATYSNIDVAKERLMCNVCDRVFTTVDTLRHHSVTHRNPLDVQVCCVICEMVIYSQMGLGNHRRDKHAMRKCPLECHLCVDVKRFSSVGKYNAHIREMHSTQTRNFSCPVSGCTKKFVRLSSRNRHISERHNGKTDDSDNKTINDVVDQEEQPDNATTSCPMRPSPPRQSSETPPTVGFPIEVTASDSESMPVAAPVIEAGLKVESESVPVARVKRQHLVCPVKKCKTSWSSSIRLQIHMRQSHAHTRPKGN